MMPARTLTPNRSQRQTGDEGTGGSIASRPAGRHREAGQRPPSLLAPDFPLGEGPLGRHAAPGVPDRHNRPFGADPFSATRLGGKQSGGKRTRTMAITTLAFVMAVGVVGGLALLNSTSTSHSASAATPGIPLPALRPIASAASSALPAQITAHPYHSVIKLATTGTAAGGMGQAPPSASRPPTARVSGPPIAVTYVLASESASGFVGEIKVTNNTSSPIADWQMALALYGDVVTSVQNASSFFSNSILLLQPNLSGQIIPPHGGTLKVSFVAEGVRTIPVACTFNGISCTLQSRALRSRALRSWDSVFVTHGAALPE